MAWQNVQGLDPQTGEVVDRFDCVVFVWQPKLTIELRKGLDGVQKAVESFRNEVVKREDRRRLPYDKTG